MSQQPPTRLLLIRHAESVANAEGRMQGSGNDPLTPRGESQARYLAEWLHRHKPGIDVILCSPLDRARRTAQIVGDVLGLAIQPHPGLQEVSLGRLENTDAATLSAVVEANDLASYDAELPLDFAQRVIAAIHDIVAEHAGKTIIIITHLGVVCNTMAHWLDNDIERAWALYGADMPNVGLRELEIGATSKLVDKQNLWKPEEELRL